MIQPTIDDFMRTSDLGNYFDCTYQSNDGKFPPKPCPSTDIIHPIDGTQMTFALREPSGFYDLMETKYGIERDWVNIFTREVQKCLLPSCTQGHLWLGNPEKATDVVVVNPKDYITNVTLSFDHLQVMIKATYLDMVLGSWDGSTGDALQTLLMPVALIEQAVTSMENIKEVGEKVKEEKKRKFIFEIVTAILAVVPFVGEEAAAAGGLAALSRAMMMIIGEFGNLGTGIYSIISDPESAPMVVMGWLFGAKALARESKTFTKARERIESMAANDIKKMGTQYSRKDQQVKDIMGPCKAPLSLEKCMSPGADSMCSVLEVGEGLHFLSSGASS